MDEATQDQEQCITNAADTGALDGIKTSQDKTQTQPPSHLRLTSEMAPLLIFSVGTTLCVNAQNISANSTFDAFVPTTVAQLLTSSIFQPTYVPFATIHNTYLELQSSFNSTFVFSQNITLPETFKHSERMVHYGLALMYGMAGFPRNTPGVAQISFAELSKRFFLAAIMHDLGVTNNTEALTHPAHAMSFELWGAFMAYDHLHEALPELNAVQVGDVTESIALHTTEYFKGNSSATGWLLQNTALFDILGYDVYGPGSFAPFWNTRTIAEIEQAFPRDTFIAEFIDGFLAEQEVLKPNCIFSHSFWDLNDAKISTINPFTAAPNVVTRERVVCTSTLCPTRKMINVDEIPNSNEGSLDRFAV
ncbi:hypothetical protein BT96DRAFT_925906 [Gymnopus androsaceus JB14]|uniref:HD domain-containing protein n=1 Tax=Gymnopus androsaceus JB14 TaxID=1447944 RepID=A0A6A4GZJ8_9AGAR|nr:hypothetical protein BT96DRAFT_925906 [Gymnopus androsaceus JB14]